MPITSRFLLDTHIFLWFVLDDKRLSRLALDTIINPANDCLISVASIWEMGIKWSIGKLELPENFSTFVPRHMALNSFSQLGMEYPHIVRATELPWHHRDPSTTCSPHSP